MTGSMQRGHAELDKLLAEGAGHSAGGHIQFSYLNFSNNQCIRQLRFTKEVMSEICQLLQTQLQPQSRALPVAVKVTVALNFYGSDSFQATAGDLNNILQDKQQERARGFARIAGFLMVQDDIDCTHIAMHVPHLNLAMFMNRKGFHSLNVQLVCDHTQRIVQVSAHYPGNSRDSFILRQSNAPPIFQPARQVKSWLLGDKGYPLMKWLMTPGRNACISAQQVYNESHATAWNIIKHTMGILKQRFCCHNRPGGALQYSANLSKRQRKRRKRPRRKRRRKRKWRKRQQSRQALSTRVLGNQMNNEQYQ
ncbi:putative nuclease HARBI1 [Heptranchias perlo]|uniref:putative nuclease HARBI1 n=1 Tax=Heptranchias perlo TaxID=212740 RepID=UPI00355969C7